jgi:hypothetical protein
MATALPRCNQDPAAEESRLEQSSTLVMLGNPPSLTHFFSACGMLSSVTVCLFVQIFSWLPRLYLYGAGPLSNQAISNSFVIAHYASEIIG